jgi:hypothetical protein
MDANSYHPLMYDRGRGPELRSCRITVYDLIPYLESPNYRDEYPLEAWQVVTREELDVLKRFIADHREEMMAEHRRIEERIQREMAEQATPEFLARFWWNRERLDEFAEYLAAVMPELKQPSDAPAEYFRHRREFRAMVEARESDNLASNRVAG